MKYSFKDWKKIDLLIQFVLLAIPFALYYFYSNDYSTETPMVIGFFSVVLLYLVQILSFFLNYFHSAPENKSGSRKFFKIGFIIHHILIIPSAFAMFVPLIFTSAFLSLFYFGMTLFEYVNLRQHEIA